MEKATDNYPDATPIAQALIAANPERVLWGSDWPHPNSAYGRTHGATAIAPARPIDDGRVFNQLPTWAPDPADPEKILVENPARLYGFEAAAVQQDIPTGTVPGRGRRGSLNILTIY